MLRCQRHVRAALHLAHSALAAHKCVGTLVTELETSSSSSDSNFQDDEIATVSRSRFLNKPLVLPSAVKVFSVDVNDGGLDANSSSVPTHRLNQHSRPLPKWLTNFVGYALKVIQTIPEQRMDEQQVFCSYSILFVSHFCFVCL
jgi:hypothetical protein